MVVAVIGVGVNTFYPSPAEKYADELQKLYRQQESFNIKQPDAEMTAEDEAKYTAIQRQIDDINAKQQDEMEGWARTSSIILVLSATLVMGVSLVRSEQLRVISNGLLLGGLFTMVYGAGWSIFSGNSVARFAVIVFALAMTLGLGYVKFVRQRKAATELAVAVAPAVGETAGSSTALDALAVRVAAIESRMNAIAAGFGIVDSGREKV